MHENEVAYIMQQKLDLLQSELQLANERERAATQTAAKATQMAEIAQGQQKPLRGRESFELLLLKPKR